MIRWSVPSMILVNAMALSTHVTLDPIPDAPPVVIDPVPVSMEREVSSVRDLTSSLRNVRVLQQATLEGDLRRVEESFKRRRETASRTSRVPPASTVSRTAEVLPASTAVSGSCSEWMAAAGITDVVNASLLIARESGCNPYARNPSSGACGIGQALPCSKMNCAVGDGYCQMAWMRDYVLNRYGSWAAAWSFWLVHHWY